MTTSTPEKQEGLDGLNTACKTIEERITASGGSFNIQMAPKVVTATDEADLAKQLEKAEQENAEVGNWNLQLGVVHKLRLKDVVGRWSKNFHFLSTFIP
jgi:hypothetical protein